MPLSHVVGHWENTLLGRLIRSTAYDRRESGVSGVVLRPRSNGNFDPSGDSLIAMSISDQEKLMKKLSIISLLVLVAVSAIAFGDAKGRKPPSTSRYAEIARRFIAPVGKSA